MLALVSLPAGRQIRGMLSRKNASDWMVAAALLACASTAHAALLTEPPGFEVQESFEEIDTTTPGVSRLGGANLLQFSGELPLPSGITLVNEGTYVANFAIAPPTPVMSYPTGSFTSASDLPPGFGHSFLLGNNGVITLKFAQDVSLAGAFVIIGANNETLTVTAYNRDGNVLGSGQANTTDSAGWGTNFAGWYDAQQRIAALSFTGSNVSPVLLDKVRVRVAAPPPGISVTDEPAGVNCAAGGAVIRSGPDLNGDASIDESEATETSYACNALAGASGADGAPGTPGQDGERGPTGSTGMAGVSALTLVAEESPGATCEHGGHIVSAGIDSNANGVLDANEVTSTATVCEQIEARSGGCSGSPQPPLGLMLLTLLGLAIGGRGKGGRSNVRRLA